MRTFAALLFLVIGVAVRADVSITVNAEGMTATNCDVSKVEDDGLVINLAYHAALPAQVVDTDFTNGRYVVTVRAGAVYNTTFTCLDGSYVQAGPTRVSVSEPLRGRGARSAFQAGFTMQIGFELVGLLVRLVRSMRASGNVDVGG